ncbi:hypothetical protein C8R45DRAFT_928133 [Mycena sanguinolenta]|nr:hypothetical protein C8R45DRAFT_928133 [Mycena sanguinolenta]
MRGSLGPIRKASHEVTASHSLACNHLYSVSLSPMDIDTLVQATSALQMGYHCCNSCCKPPFYFRANDPSEEVLSRAQWVQKKRLLRDVAYSKVDGISSAQHESVKTANGAREIWACYCHAFHPHSSSLPQTASIAGSSTGAPPPYQAPPSAGAATSLTTPNRGGGALAPATPVRVRPERFYRVAGSSRVLINRAQAKTEMRASGTSTLVFGDYLETVEDDDDDDEVTPIGGLKFYHVFGNPNVRTNRYLFIIHARGSHADLMASTVNGLWVGTSLEEVEGM